MFKIITLYLPGKSKLTALGILGFLNSYLLVVQADQSPPPVPIPMDVQQIACNKVKLTWTNTTDEGSGIKDYMVSMNGALLELTEGVPEFDSADGRREIIMNVTPGQSYTFEVRSRDQAGWMSLPASKTIEIENYQSVFCIDSQTPAKPDLQSVSHYPGGECQEFTFTPKSMGDQGQYKSGITAFKLYRDNKPYRKIPLTGTGNISNDGLTQYDRGVGMFPGHNYTFELTTVDGAGKESPRSEPVNYTTPECDSLVSEDSIINVLLISAYFAGEQPRFDESEIDNIIFGDSTTGSLSLHGAINDYSGNTVFLAPTGLFGWIELPGSPEDYNCNVSSGLYSNCNTQLIIQDLLLLSGANPGNYHRSIFVIDKLATKAGTGKQAIVGINNGSLESNLPGIIHEFLHTVKLAHAGQWNCPGSPMSISPYEGQSVIGPNINDPQFSCVLSNYGDKYSVMNNGGTHNHPSMFQKVLAGFARIDDIFVIPWQENMSIYGILASVTVQNPVSNRAYLIPLNEDAPNQPPFYLVEWRTLDGYNAVDFHNTDHFLQVRYIADDSAGSDGSFVMSEMLIRNIPLSTINSGDAIFKDVYRNIRIELLDFDANDGDKPALIHISR
jgi:hypothetical protein